MYFLSPFRIVLFTIFLSITFTTLQAQQTESQSVYAIEGVHVLPMDRETVLENRTVIVRGDRIVTVGPAGEVEIPDGAERIDGSGKYLLPGLAEMHGHIPPPNLPDSYPETYTEDVLFLYLAAGITTVRGMLGSEGQQELKDRVDRGEMDGPHLYLAGPSFNGQTVTSPSQAAERVRRQKEEGWYLLKVHPGLTREEFDAMAQTAHEVDIPFGGHIPEAVGLLHALDSGQQTIDHLDGYIAYLEGGDQPVSESDLEEVAELSLQSGVWVVPTMALWETIIGSADYEQMEQFDELKYMPPVVLDQWRNSVETIRSNSNMETAGVHAENRLKLLKALSDAGVPILMGTDAPQLYSVPGFSIHRELPFMSRAGMSTYEILKSGTLAVGEYFSDVDRFGTVAADQRADLLLVDRNPLENLEHLQQLSGVMVGGKWLPKSEIDRRLAEIEQRNRAE